MADRLSVARDLANRVRFTGDDSPRERPRGHATDFARSLFSENDVLISPDVTPSLADCLRTAIDRLGIPTDAIEAYVYASGSIQAECIASNERECIVRFSSALIELMEDSELQFVAGHEIGHFLLNHGKVHNDVEGATVEHYMRSRNREVSADRLGLLCCRSLEASIRALMKTASGLGSNRLRFDVGAFLSQIRKIDERYLHQNAWASHPSIIVRCRALLWFSLSDAYQKDWTESDREQLNKLDQRVDQDFRRFFDKPVRDRIDSARKDLSIWLAARLAFGDGAFHKAEQAYFAKTFGDEVLSKLRQFIEGMTTAEVVLAVDAKVAEAIAELRQLTPASLNSEIERLTAEVEVAMRHT